MPDHVHMMASIPPKYSVAQVVGYIKGKSAIHIARVYMERRRNDVGQHFWTRGYFVSTVGRDEAVIGEYIRHHEQKAPDRALQSPSGRLDSCTPARMLRGEGVKNGLDRRRRLMKELYLEDQRDAPLQSDHRSHACVGRVRECAEPPVQRDQAYRSRRPLGCRQTMLANLPTGLACSDELNEGFSHCCRYGNGHLTPELFQS